jgi:hypothetical protein
VWGHPATVCGWEATTEAIITRRRVKCDTPKKFKLQGAQAVEGAVIGGSTLYGKELMSLLDYYSQRALSLWPINCSNSRAAFIPCVVCYCVVLRALSPGAADCSKSPASSHTCRVVYYWAGSETTETNSRVLDSLGSRPLLRRSQCSVCFP